MIIRKGVLFSVSEKDLDPSGALRIPEGVTNIAKNVGNSLAGLQVIYFPDSLNEIKNSIFNNNPLLKEIFFGNSMAAINSNAFLNCEKIESIQLPPAQKAPRTSLEMTFANLKHIVKYDSSNQPCYYPVKKYNGKFYYETFHKQIGPIRISLIYTMDNEQRFCLHVTSGPLFIGKSLKSTAYEYRKYFLMQEFERTMWMYKATSSLREETLRRYEFILREALKESINKLCPVINKKDQKRIRNYIKNIALYVDYIAGIEKKYKGAAKQFYELYGLTFEELLNKISPETGNKLGKTCTRLVKKRPIAPTEMSAIVNAGYENPGAFPFSWLKNIKKDNRSAATKKLHELFKKASIKMYSPDKAQDQTTVLESLSKKISKIIKQEIEIKYLESGNFSKTYTLQIPGDKKYVWKIYHCNKYWKTITSYHHDTELQNSFLVGGKKYHGKLKFRKISTAGISNQLGETYLIYPYTEEEPISKIMFRPIYNTKPYSLIDMNENNFLGNTLIDIGGLRIDYNNWQQPRYISKIANTILYHSWNDIGYVLNNYNSRQIRDAIDFLNGRLSTNALDFNKIQAKIEFLKNKTRTR